jgi:hypothetical protein
VNKCTCVTCYVLHFVNSCTRTLVHSMFTLSFTIPIAKSLLFCFMNFITKWVKCLVNWAQISSKAGYYRCVFTAVLCLKNQTTCAIVLASYWVPLSFFRCNESPKMQELFYLYIYIHLKNSLFCIQTKLFFEKIKIWKNMAKRRDC